MGVFEAGLLVVAVLVLLGLIVLAPVVAFRIGRALGSRFDRGER